MLEKSKSFVTSKVTALSVGMGMMFASVASHAALPAAVGTAFTDLLTDINSLIDLAWTVVVPVTIAFIIIGMFKRAAYSAT
jgi:hypothetical protein